MRIFVFLPCALLALAGPAAAQDSGSDAPSTPCQAQPQGKGQQPPPADDGSGNSAGNLGSCDGVLRPPPSGDQGMTQPPPDQGKTPVIKPGEVPAQPPKQ